MRDSRRHGHIRRVITQQFLRGGEFLSGVLRRLLFRDVLLLFFRGKFAVLFHEFTSGVLFENGGESFPGAMQFAANRIGGLLG